MEKLYDTGKRVERIIYSSVFVIIVSFAFYSLSVSILKDSNKLNLDTYQSLVDELNLDYPYYKQAENLRGALRAYVARKNQEDFSKVKSKPLLDAEDIKLQEENDVRSSLGLPVFSSKETLRINNNYAILEVENEKNLKQANFIRKRFGLPETVSERLALKTYDEMKSKLLQRFIFVDQAASIEFSNTILNSGDFDNLFSALKRKLGELSQNKIKVLNIEAPLQFPLSLGEMKSNISLYNVSRMGMTVYPVFLIFWIGSLCMTRSREIFFLIQCGKVMRSYPHVLNLFSVLTSDFKGKTKKRNRHALFVLGDKKTILLETSLAFSKFGVRIFIGISLLVLITFPAYFGFVSLYFSGIMKAEAMQISIILICGAINIFQLLIFVFNEFKLAGVVFITGGDLNDL